MRIVCLLLLAMPLFAQNALYLDISGPWRTMDGDDLRYARADFDDSGWQTVSVPWVTPLAPERYFWLRRAVDLPPGADGSKLALTLGAISETYEVYVNGSLAGSTGAFAAEQAHLARTRVFDLPAQSSTRMAIAIRVWRHGRRGFGSWEIRDTGPYLLTSIVNAPRALESVAIDQRKIRGAPRVVLSGVLIALVILILIAWFGDRGRKEFLWLAIYLASVAMRSLLEAFGLSSDATPWTPSSIRGGFIAIDLPMLALGMLAAAALGFRRDWWIRALYIAPLYTLSGLDWLPRNLPSWFAELLTGMIIFWPQARLSVASARAGERHLIQFALALCLLFEIRFNRYARIPLLSSIPSGIDIGRYTLGSLDVITTAFGMVMVVVLLRRLILDRQEKQRLAQEMEAAGIVQKLLLGAGKESGVHYLIDAAYRPAQEVGGDFYQVLALPGNALLVAVGDVSGKGVKAAMVVAMIAGVLRNRRTCEPARLLDELNRTLAGSLDSGFVTCIVARFEPGGAVTLANAGHLAPYKGGLEIEIDSSLPLGVVAEVEYGERRLTVQAGEKITFVTDGIVEAAHAQGQLFGFDRTRAISGKPAAEIAEAVRAWGQNDDITVVSVTRRRD